jgi:hypothetical protein
MAACFAISNLGHEVPKSAAENVGYWSTDPRVEVEGLAGHLMESDEHERIFAQEAQGWLKYVTEHPVKELLRVHPNNWWIQAIVDA